MVSFANELAQRLSANQDFSNQLLSLQSAGAAATLPSSLRQMQAEIPESEIVKLLYCASIFAQSENEAFRTQAQSIALNSILINDDAEIRERCIRILTELGNFPSINYLEESYGTSSNSLIGLLQRGVAEELNSVVIGDQKLSLTDYQKKVWDTLPNVTSMAISAPTSAGKSFLVIEYLCRMAKNSSSFMGVYVAPTRALLSEVNQTITKRMVADSDIRISTIPTLGEGESARQIFILTQERLQVLLSISDMKFDLVVIDEVQNLSDGQRGMILQESIEQIVQRNGKTQIVMLAPGAEGFSEAAKSIGLKEIHSESTLVSPVLQNRILVGLTGIANELSLGLLVPSGVKTIGTLATNRGFAQPVTRLAAVALELGATGGSLVYATGPTESEEVASQLAIEKDIENNKVLGDLAEFIESHIHPEYRLASMVRRGVGFHYGKMPNLLREALEAAFKSADIKFLTCTTTLFQGVNLPARNVFIGTPTRGKGTPLDPALLWNFAGRAGRMKKDIVGNVFLVDYDNWESKPMGNMVRFKIAPAFNSTVTESYNEVLSGLQGSMPKKIRNDDTPERVRAAVGLLIARASKGDVGNFVRRVLPELGESDSDNLIREANGAVELIGLPPAILSTNWMIDPFGQRRLYDKIVEFIRNDDIDVILPISPHDDAAYQVYSAIFNMIAKAIYGYEGTFGNYVAVYALPWMKGIPYPVILSKAIKYEKDRISKLKTAKARSAPPNISKVVRNVFDTIEDVVRFQYVQMGKAFLDILILALRVEGKENIVPRVFDFSLALELGVATASGRSFIELGLSRIAASVLDEKFPNSNLSSKEARELIWKTNFSNLGLSSVIINELRSLNLIPDLVQ